MEPEYKTKIYKQVFFGYTLRNYLSHIKPRKTDLTYNDLKSKSFTYPLNNNTLSEIAFVVYENLKKTLSENIVKQIEDSCKDNHYTCFLITGKDNNLIDGIVSYLYYLYAPSLRGSFVYKNFSGKDEDTLKKISFEPSYKGKTLRSMKPEELAEALLRSESGFLSHYFNGDMLFLRGVGNSPDILKQVAGLIRDYESRVVRMNPGVLIMSMGDDSNLPEEFKGLFGVIRLEPEKQDLSTRKIAHFPLPHNARIRDIKMVSSDDENVRITIGNKTASFHYAQMGFSNKSNGRPLAEWHTLLEYLENGGCLANIDTAKQKRNERLHVKLKAFFGTNEDIIVNHQTVFKVKKREKHKKPIHIQEKECPSCHENHRHFCFSCNDETGHCKECHDDLYREIHEKLIS